MQETIDQLIDTLIQIGGRWEYLKYDASKWAITSLLSEKDVFAGAGGLYIATHHRCPHSPQEIWLPRGSWTFAQGIMREKAEVQRVEAVEEAVRTLKWFVDQAREWNNRP